MWTDMGVCPRCFCQRAPRSQGLLLRALCVPPTNASTASRLYEEKWAWYLHGRCQLRRSLQRCCLNPSCSIIDGERCSSPALVLAGPCQPQTHGKHYDLFFEGPHGRIPGGSFFSLAIPSALIQRALSSSAGIPLVSPPACLLGSGLEGRKK